MKTVRPFFQTDRFLLISSHWVLYGTVLFIYTVSPYYRSLLSVTVPFTRFSPQELLFGMLCCFTCFLLIVRIPDGSFQKSRVYFTFQALTKISRAMFSGRLDTALTPVEKTSVLLLLVKFLFVPIMFRFLIQNFSGATSSFRIIFSSPQALSLDIIISTVYPLILSILLLVDTAYFFTDYLIESRTLGNEIRSVDTTALGWLSALACYPPFNEVTRTFFGWHSADFSDFGSIGLNLFFGGLSLVCMSLYAWATLSLGWKASNLTNRGIVSRWAYAFVRHPAYISKNLAWWIMGIPFILAAFSRSLASHQSIFSATIASLIPVISLMAWSGIYYIRALTEERHLSLDPEYREYMRKVKYRFLPGIL